MSYLLLNSNAKQLPVKFYKTCNGYKVMSLKVRIHVNLVSMEIWVLLYWDDMFLQEPFCVSVMNTGWHMLYVMSLKTLSSLVLQLILASVLNALYDSINQILRKNVEKRSLLENLDAAFLVVDEICDGGQVCLLISQRRISL